MIIKGSNPNAHWSDPRLNWKAKGILGYLLSQSAFFEVKMTDLMSRSKDGTEAVRSAMAELCKLGYAKLVLTRNDKGQTHGLRWIVGESPEAMEGAK